MKFNKKKFFDGFRAEIDETIEQEQVDGLDFLLDAFAKDPLWKDVRHIAYALATTYHETAGSFQPVEEGYYLGNATRVRNFQKTLRYYPFYGRGYVQLTWKKNYERAGKALGVNFVNQPELVMAEKNAFAIMSIGMHEGWFTGEKLADYIHGNTADYKNARKIINGLDRAALIAGYARKFERILRDSAAVPADNPAPLSSSEKPREQESDRKSAPSRESASMQSPSDPVNVNIDKAENVNVENKPPPSDKPVEVKVERVSIWAKIGLAFAAITGMGINLGNLVTTKLNEMTLPQLGYILGGVAILAVGLWLYDRAARRAHEKTLVKMATASDPSKTTVELREQTTKG